MKEPANVTPGLARPSRIHSGEGATTSPEPAARRRGECREDELLAQAQGRYGRGLTAWPFTIVMKWQCGPVVQPVMPT